MRVVRVTLLIFAGKKIIKITVYNSLYIYNNIGNHWGIYYMWALRIILIVSCMSFIIVSVDLQD